MKKLFLILLLIPLNISARNLINTDLICNTNEIKLNDTINCNFIINNPNKIVFKSVKFGTKNTLENITTDSTYSLTNNDVSNEKHEYEILLNNSNSDKINLFNFNIKVTQKDFNLILENIYLDLESTDDIEIINIERNFKVQSEAYIKNILINNQPLLGFEPYIYEYTANIFDTNDLLEFKVEGCDNCTVEDNFRLVNSGMKKVIFKVNNKTTTTEYKINLNYEPTTDNLLENVTINEINFNFNPTKFNYYFSVPNNINALSFIHSNSDKYVLSPTTLNIGSNIITIKNIESNLTYSFYVERLATEQLVNEEALIKTLKVGDKYINLKNDVYEYDIAKEDNLKVTLETTIENQDYDIKYNDDKIEIVIFGLSGKNTNYTINLIEDNVNLNVNEYDNTSNIIIVCIFAALFTLIVLIAVTKYREYRKNF